MKLKDLYEAKKDENSDMNDTPPVDDSWCSTAQAAKILDVSMSRVRQFIMDGRLTSKSPEKGRRDNLLSVAQVKKFAQEERKITGRPEGATEGSGGDK